ncbi:DUF3841 domain-containing protein [Nocardioides sp. TRM66260-LWL]|uniref:DUF3841 domain-containing protein n=1 Tax=Nocardioides sp. TRM66260-LWL TaxID=2874478 RepID=UPI001CC7AE50|nr:DUF3841 domain-containing protein [Nocardioides sp. TRM66260-LWL]MBZ5735426.1 DUF3841 domain-containing protein [Nocardioides sp. TRM66260-LWL]
MLESYDRLPSRQPWQILWRHRRALPGTVDRSDADVLRLWTIQTREAYEVLVRDGALRGSPEHIEPTFAEPYAWLEGQAASRLGTGTGTLLWLWARGPATVVRGSAVHGADEVLLEVVKPRDEVLLSRFDAWHSCLNGYPHLQPAPDESDAEYDRRLDVVYDLYDDARREHGDLPLLMQEVMQWSWCEVIDPDRFEPNEVLQACVHEIAAGDVIGAWRIRSRPRDAIKRQLKPALRWLRR